MLNIVGDVLSLGPTKLWVLEQDTGLFSHYCFAQLIEVDLADATNINRVQALPSTGEPRRLTVAKKRTVRDLEDLWESQASKNQPLPLFEGITLAAPGPDGNRPLLIVSDHHNDPRRGNWMIVAAARID